MSFGIIIVAVKEHPELWAPSHQLYRSRIARDRAWKAISRKVGTDVDTLKKHWKNLKDAFRKELKKINSKEILTSNWKHYNALTFITEEIIAGRRYKKNKINKDEPDSLSDDEQPLSKRQKKTSDPTEVTEKTKPSASVDSIQTKPVDNQQIVTEDKKINLILYRINKIKKLIQNKNEALEDDLSKDSDYLYLVSLLPIIKKLSDIQKLYFRGKINEWLIQAVTESQFINEYDSKIDIDDK